MSYYPPTDWEMKDFYRGHVDAVYRSCCFLTGGRGDAQAMVKEIFLRLLNKGMQFSSEKDARAWMILTAYKMSRRPPKKKIEQNVEDTPREPQQVPAQELEATQPQESVQTPEDQQSSEAEQILEPENTPKEQHPQETEQSSEEEKPQEAEQDQEPEETSVPEQSPEEEKLRNSEAVQEPEAQPEQDREFPPEIMKLSRKDRLVALLYYCEGYRKSEIADYLGCTTMRIRSRLKRVKKQIPDEMGGDE